MNPSASGWKELVKSARSNPERVDDIYRRLSKPMYYAARKCPSMFRDDVMQAGRVAVWRKLRAVDLRRSEIEIGAFLRCVAINGIRDELRHQIRQERANVSLDQDETLATTNEKIYIPSDSKHFFRILKEFQFSNLLRMYAGYVRQHGHFVGAHKTIAARLGISIPLVTRRFHAQSQKWVSANDLTTTKKKHGKIIEMVINGQISQ